MAGKAVTFLSGNASNGNGGTITLNGGNGVGTNRSGGDIVIQAGDGTGTGTSSIQFKTKVNGTNSSAERMRIHTDGNIGIGTTAPGTMLQLEGPNAYLTLKNTTSENGDGGAETKIIFEDHSNTSLAHIQGSHDGTSDDTKGNLIFKTNTGSALTEALRIDSSQNVGIGTNAPSSKLDIKSSGSHLRLVDTSDTDRVGELYIEPSGLIGNLILKSTGPAADIFLDTMGGDIQFAHNTSFFGGVAKNNNNFLIYSSINNESIVYKNNVSGSLTQILELNKSINSGTGLATLDADLNLNGALVCSQKTITVTNAYSTSNNNNIIINFSDSDGGDYKLNIVFYNSNSYNIIYTNSSNNIGQKGKIIIVNSNANDLTLDFKNSNGWYATSSLTPDVSINGDIAIYDYYIIDSNKVHISGASNITEI